MAVASEVPLLFCGEMPANGLETRRRSTGALKCALRNAADINNTAAIIRRYGQAVRRLRWVSPLDEFRSCSGVDGTLRYTSVLKSKSARTSCTIDASTCDRFEAQASDMELKQRLLMFRGMPNECFAIVASASRENIAS